MLENEPTDKNNIFNNITKSNFNSKSSLLQSKLNGAESELVEVKERWRSIVESAPDFISIIDENGIIKYINRGIANLKVNNLVGKSIYDFMDHENIDAAKKVIEGVFLRENSDNAELRISINGSVRWYQTYIGPIKINNKVDSATINATEITDRIVAEKNLIVEQDKLKNIMDAMDDVAYIVGKDYSITYINPASVKNFGPVDNSKCYEYIHNRDNPCPWCENEEIFKGKTVQKEWYRPKTNKTYDIFNTAIKNMDGSISKFVKMHDITQRKRAERKLFALNCTLEDRVKKEVERRRLKEHILIQQSRLASMGEMIGAIAHQWRQPLNALGLIIQSIKDAYLYKELTKGFIDQVVDKSLFQIDYMSKTIDDFRNFFKPSKEKNAFDAAKTINEVLYLLSAQIKDNYITVRFDNDLKGDKSIWGYENEFKQVVINIIKNAMDAIMEAREKGNLGYDAGYNGGEITINLTNGDDIIFISISDNAGAIPDEILDKVFEPYFTTKGPSKGTGIGLYMSKMIIERNMEGKLYTKNRDDNSVFIIELKVADQESPPLI